MIPTILALVIVMIGSYIGGFLSGGAFEKAQKGNSMKVKEVISELQKLDQERNIWISYDGANDDECGFTNGIFDPIPDDIVKQPLVDDCKKYQEYKDVKVGDYLIKVG